MAPAADAPALPAQVRTRRPDIQGRRPLCGGGPGGLTSFKRGGAYGCSG